MDNLTMKLQKSNIQRLNFSYDFCSNYQFLYETKLVKEAITRNHK